MPTWSTDRLRRKAGGKPPRDEPLVTVARQGARRVLLNVDVAARKLGLAPGMTLTHAQSLLPDLHLADANMGEDHKALQRLAIWCLTYSPLVTIAPPDGIFIDITGSAHLFKGEEALIEQLLERLHGGGFAARACVADTPGGAYAVARCSRTRVIGAGQIVHALASLPVKALRLPDEVVTALRDVGIERIAQLAPLPRGSIRSRFGALVLRRLDQALGTECEPLAPVTVDELPYVSRSFAEPVSAPDTLERIITELAARLCVLLEQRCVGARRVDLVFKRVDGLSQAARIGLSAASRDARRIARLLKERLVQVDPGFGIDEAVLTASWVEALSEHQIAGIVDDKAACEAPDLGGLVDVLAVRLGDDRIFRTAGIESEIPEMCVARVPATGAAIIPSWPADLPRPIRLVSPPSRVEVIAQIPDHPPRLFIWNRTRHRITQADGPERIRGEWWTSEKGVSECRDYYRVETTSGERFWLFRDGMAEATPRWWLHGIGDA